MWHSATDFIGQWHLMRLGLETDRNKPTLTLKCSRNFKCENIWTNSYLDTLSLDYKLVSRVRTVRWWWSWRGQPGTRWLVSCYQDSGGLAASSTLSPTLRTGLVHTGHSWPTVRSKLVIHHILGILYTLPTYRNIFMSKCLETLTMSSRSWLCGVDKVILIYLLGSV